MERRHTRRMTGRAVVKAIPETRYKQRKEKKQQHQQIPTKKKAQGIPLSFTRNVNDADNKDNHKSHSPTILLCKKRKTTKHCGCKKPHRLIPGPYRRKNPHFPLPAGNGHTPIQPDIPEKES